MKLAIISQSTALPTRLCMPLKQHRLGFDDALDAFYVHGVGGVCGGFLTGFFANDFVSGSPDKRGAFYGNPRQIGIQVSLPFLRKASRVVTELRYPRLIR